MNTFSNSSLTRYTSASLLKVGIFVVLFSGVIASCSKYPKAKLELTVEQAPFQRIIADYLEADRIFKSDTLSLKNFKTNWKVSFNRSEPYFIRLRSDSGILATLLVAPGEKVKIFGKYPGFATNYSVQGSEGSDLCRQLNLDLALTSKKLDSLYNQLSTLSPEQRNTQKFELGKVFIKQKQKSTTFIIRNIHSLATAMALYQNVSNQIPLFGSDQDLFLFQAVRDSLSKHYPTSSYVKALSRDIKLIEQSASETHLRDLISKAPIVGAPDFRAIDRFGAQIQLSRLKGKVVILNFWVSNNTDCLFFQKELRVLYDQYQSRGLEIIQIGLDVDQATWIQAIQNFDLPGIQINDFKGSKSAIAMLYNVPKLPYCFIINKQGDLSFKNVNEAELKSAVTSLL